MRVSSRPSTLSGLSPEARHEALREPEGACRQGQADRERHRRRRDRVSLERQHHALPFDRWARWRPDPDACQKPRRHVAVLGGGRTMYEYGTSRGWAPRMSLTAREIERNVRQRAALRREAETKRRVAPLVAQRLPPPPAGGRGGRGGG